MPSYPLRELRALLADPAPTRGVIVRVVRSTADVATPAGLQKAKLRVALEVGSTVDIRNGWAEPAAVPTAVYAL